MSFKNEMKVMGKMKIELKRERERPIEEEKYALFYNVLVNEQLKPAIKHRIKHGWVDCELRWLKKYYYYGTGIDFEIYVTPSKEREFKDTFSVKYIQSRNSKVVLETAYLEDVEKALLCLYNNIKEDEFDDVIFCEKKICIELIHEIILKLETNWQENVNRNLARYSAEYLGGIGVYIKCDKQGNII